MIARLLNGRGHAWTPPPSGSSIDADLTLCGRRLDADAVEWCANITCPNCLHLAALDPDRRTTR